jgi:hypothetical protein
MRRVIVESPYKGNIIQRWLNRRYARACVRDCLLRGEAPFASHLLYTQRGILKDEIATERKLGMTAGWEWGSHGDAYVFYTDRGFSGGMNAALNIAKANGYKVEYRSLTDTPRRVISE